jgi:hypothetical protein
VRRTIRFCVTKERNMKNFKFSAALLALLGSTAFASADTMQRDGGPSGRSGEPDVSAYTGRSDAYLGYTGPDANDYRRLRVLNHFLRTLN